MGTGMEVPLPCWKGAHDNNKHLATMFRAVMCYDLLSLKRNKKETTSQGNRCINSIFSQDHLEVEVLSFQ